MHFEPAEQTPARRWSLQNYFEETGLPRAWSILLMFWRKRPAQRWSLHPGVERCFTGSAAVGKIIVKERADTLKV